MTLRAIPNSHAPNPAPSPRYRASDVHAFAKTSAVTSSAWLRCTLARLSRWIARACFSYSEAKAEVSPRWARATSTESAECSDEQVSGEVVRRRPTVVQSSGEAENARGKFGFCPVTAKPTPKRPKYDEMMTIGDAACNFDTECDSSTTGSHQGAPLMRRIVLTAVALTIATAVLAGSPAGAEEPSGASSDWPAAADVFSSNLVVDLSGDGVDDIWIFEVDVERRHDANDIAARCRAAGLTPGQCRRILHDHHSDLAERCRNAGLTVEQCRRIINSHDGPTIAERCRAAGLTSEECRRLVNSHDGPTIAERCRAAGLTAEECRRIVNAHSDREIDERRVDRVTDRVTDRITDRVTDRVTDRPSRTRR